MFQSPPAIKSTLIAVSLALSAFSLNAQATLTSFSNSGQGLVYSSVSNVTWTKDANLLGTMMAADNTLVNKILIASNGISYDNVYNSYHLTASDFRRDGQTSWFGANAFVTYLNSISYAGSTSWRLPTVANTTFGYNTATNGTTKGDELVELYYQELGSKANPSGDYDGIKDPNNTFNNIPAKSYWSGTEYVPNRYFVWNFDTFFGTQRIRDKLSPAFHYAWAVTAGDLRTSSVSAVPAPAAAWLFATGLPIIGAFARRRNQSNASV